VLLKQAASHFDASDWICKNENTSGGARHHLIVATPTDVRVFIRSPENPSDVVCCLCGGAEEVPRITDHAIGIFQDMSGAI
jgi:hypothetical protein